MDTKLRIVDLLEKNRQGVHLREIARLLNTSLTNVQAHIAHLEKEGVVRRKKTANLSAAVLKDCARTTAYLKQLHTEKFLSLPQKVNTAMDDFLGELDVPPLIALIFGSYAKGTFTKGSDLDILLVFQKVEKTDRIENIAKKISSRANLQLSPVYVDYASFGRNFLDKRHDFSNELKQGVIIVSGVEHYYHLLWRFLQ